MTLFSKFEKLHELFQRVRLPRGFELGRLAQEVRCHCRATRKLRHSPPPTAKNTTRRRQVLCDRHVRDRVLRCNKLAGNNVQLADLLAERATGDAVVEVESTLAGVAFLLPLMYLDAAGLKTLRDEIQRAIHARILVMANEHGKRMGNLGEFERAALREANDSAEAVAAGSAPYPLLVTLVDRFDEVFEEHGDDVEAFLGDKPILLLREVPADVHSTAATAGGYPSCHCDEMQSDADIRVGLSREARVELQADPAYHVLARCIYTFGAATKTFIADLKSRWVLEATAPCGGAGISLDATVRAQTPGTPQWRVHAGASEGMPLRLQVMPDVAILKIDAYNTTAARFLLEDLATMQLADAGAQTRLMGALAAYLGLYDD